MSTVSSSLPLPLQLAELSDVGMRRPNNQDSLTSVIVQDAETWRQRGHLLMIADGMGAHAAGELASKLAVDNVPQAYYKLNDMAPPAALRHAVREANRVIHAKGQNSLEFQGMGTTCTCLVILPQGALVAHVGDSRAYRLRRNSFVQLSFDHSLVWEAAATGQLPEENLLSVLPKNVITRSLGPHETVNVDLEGPHEILPGDVFLVCSDGLSGQVTDEELGTIIGQLAPQDAVQTLVDLANLRGGPDNISVIVARVEGESPESESKDVASRIAKSSPPAVSVPAGLWFAMAICLVLIIIAGLASSPLGMLIGATGFGASAAIAVVRHFAPVAETSSHALSGPYGNGPYRTFDCTPHRKVADSLADLANQLQERSGHDDWPVDMNWAPIQKLKHQAVEANHAGDFAAAIRSYCDAIRMTMKQIREHRATVTTQSGINLQ